MLFNGDNVDLNYSASVGMDIEFPVKNTKGNFVSAIPYIEGTKDNPTDCSGGNVQRDNVALEIAVDLSYNSFDFINSMRDNLQYAINLLPKGYTIGHEASALYNMRELKHAEAKEFGCDADYDAKTGSANTFTFEVVDERLRTFGLHVHTGIGKKNNRLYTLLSDFVLGLFSTLKDNSETSIRRRSLYGKPSCYREKDYGVEYRTLSNFWARSPRLIRIVWELNSLIHHIHMSNGIGMLFSNVDIHRLSDIILAGDDVAAGELFFEHIYSHLDFQTQRILIDELDYKDYKSINVEWDLSTEDQPETKYDAYREDYFKTPKCEEVYI